MWNSHEALSVSSGTQECLLADKLAPETESRTDENFTLFLARRYVHVSSRNRGLW